MIIFLVLSIIDIVGGTVILLSSNLILPDIAKYIGAALLIKGIWGLILSLPKTI